MTFKGKSDFGELTTDNIKKAEEFNVYFPSSFTKNVNCDHALNSINISKGEGAQAKTGREQVKEYLDTLDVFKLAGPNEIHPRTLMELGCPNLYWAHFPLPLLGLVPVEIGSNL